jgi:hypothetical protein
VEYLLFLSDFNGLYFSRQIFKKYSILNFIKIHPVTAKLFHVEGRADIHDEANNRFSQFCKRT